MLSNSNEKKCQKNSSTHNIKKKSIIKPIANFGTRLYRGKFAAQLYVLFFYIYVSKHKYIWNKEGLLQCHSCIYVVAYCVIYDFIYDSALNVFASRSLSLSHYFYLFLLSQTFKNINFMIIMWNQCKILYFSYFLGFRIDFCWRHKFKTFFYLSIKMRSLKFSFVSRLNWKLWFEQFYEYFCIISLALLNFNFKFCFQTFLSSFIIWFMLRKESHQVKNI